MAVRTRAAAERQAAVYDISAAMLADIFAIAAERKGLRDIGLRTAAPPSETSRVAADPGILRIQHPANGVFDMVVLQSPSDDDLPDVGWHLTGNPVYSVYLRVGDRKEWLLQYCLPADSNQQVDQYRAVLPAGRPIMHPYPISTAVPGGILQRVIPGQLVFHGFLSAGGELQGMQAHPPDDTMAGQILELLAEWRFRPARQNDAPVGLEVLLVVPTHS
jgi:hypothetical protein